METRSRVLFNLLGFSIGLILGDVLFTHNLQYLILEMVGAIGFAVVLFINGSV